MTKPYNPPRLALIMPSFVAMGHKKEFIRAVDSIRAQTVMPWAVIVLDFGRGAYFDRECKAAIEQLRLFCPDVQLIPFPRYNDKANFLAYGNLANNDFDLVVQMSDDVVLKPDGLGELTYAFAGDADLLLANGSYAVIERPKPWWRAVWWSLRRKASWKVFAFRRTMMLELYLGERKP